jgi:putative tricarboxylic transport membrane protein
VDLVNNLAHGFALALTPENALAALIGAVIGTAIGVLPGMTPTSTMAILLAPTLMLKPETGLIVLAAVYYGSQYGDSMTAILLNIPSESPSVVIATDGYRLTRRGRAGAALALAAVASFVGANVGLIGLALAAPALSLLALKFGPADYFEIALFALLALSRITGSSIPKALLTIGIGLAATTIGVDLLAGTSRFTFGQIQMSQGVQIIPVVIGLFGLSELLNLATESLATATGLKFGLRELWPARREWRSGVPPMVRGSILGFFMGILPGPTLTLATFVSYALERRLSWRRPWLQDGDVRGVTGPKSADDAAVSGNLVPLLALGLPFSTVTAVLFAGLLLHGVQPGPLFIQSHPNIFWGFVAAMSLGNIALLILNFPLVGIWVNLLRIPKPIFLAALTVLIVVGAYGYRNSFFDLQIMVISGLIGYLMRRLNFDRTVLVLGLVLGPVLEIGLRQALLLSRGDLSTFITRPTAWVLATVLVVLLATSLLREAGRRQRVILDSTAGPGPAGP